MPLSERLACINNHLLYLEKTALVYSPENGKVNNPEKHLSKSKKISISLLPTKLMTHWILKWKRSWETTSDFTPLCDPGHIT